MEAGTLDRLRVDRPQGPPPDDLPPVETPPEAEKRTDEEGQRPLLLSFVFVAHSGMDELTAIRKAQELLQSAKSKGLVLIAARISDPLLESEYDEPDFGS